MVALAVLAGAAFARATTIGTNTPAESITRDRIMQLKPAERGAWLKYLERSERQRQADKDAFQAELKKAGITTPIEPPHGFSARGMPLDRDANWYASVEARRVADIVVSFQTPAGGWGKNMDMSKEPRKPGEKFGPNNLSQYLSPGDFDTPIDPDWNYIGTIDNDATITQIEFLCQGDFGSRHEGRDCYILRRSSAALSICLAAQYPNRGWPQVWPLEGGYHYAITYNDSAMTQVMDIMPVTLRMAATSMRFVSNDVARPRSGELSNEGCGAFSTTGRASRESGQCEAQQDDALTLEQTGVGTAIMKCRPESSGESADMVLMLMNDLPNPTA